MTLPGAGTGVLFFLTPQWDKLIELDVRIQIKYLLYNLNCKTKKKYLILHEEHLSIYYLRGDRY